MRYLIGFLLISGIAYADIFQDADVAEAHYRYNLFKDSLPGTVPTPRDLSFEEFQAEEEQKKINRIKRVTEACKIAPDYCETHPEVWD